MNVTYPYQWTINQLVNKRVRCSATCGKCGGMWGVENPPMPLIGFRCPKCQEWNQFPDPIGAPIKEQEAMAEKKSKAPKTSGGATTFVLPVEKVCGGVIKYGDVSPDSRDKLPATNMYVSKKTWTNMPKQIKVTIEPVDGSGTV